MGQSQAQGLMERDDIRSIELLEYEIRGLEKIGHYFNFFEEAPTSSDENSEEKSIEETLADQLQAGCFQSEDPDPSEQNVLACTSDLETLSALQNKVEYFFSGLKDLSDRERRLLRFSSKNYFQKLISAPLSLPLNYFVALFQKYSQLQYIRGVRLGLTYLSIKITGSILALYYMGQGNIEMLILLNSFPFNTVITFILESGYHFKNAFLNHHVLREQLKKNHRWDALRRKTLWNLSSMSFFLKKRFFDLWPLSHFTKASDLERTLSYFSKMQEWDFERYKSWQDWLQRGLRISDLEEGFHSWLRSVPQDVEPALLVILFKRVFFPFWSKKTERPFIKSWVRELAREVDRVGFFAFSADASETKAGLRWAQHLSSHMRKLSEEEPNSKIEGFFSKCALFFQRTSKVQNH